jgi:sugar phosphate permease
MRNAPVYTGYTGINAYTHKQDELDLPSGGLMSGALLVLKNRYIWSAFIVNFGIYGSFITFSGVWVIPYLMQVYGASREVAALFMMLAAMGKMVGSLTVGYFSDRIKKRKLPVNVLLLLYCATWVIILILRGGTLILFYPLYFLLGVGSAGTVVINAYAKEINHPSLTGSSTATANMGMFMGIAVIQSLFGYLLDYRWDGLIVQGVKVYSLGAYRLGFQMCFGFAVVSLIASLFLRETESKNIYKNLSAT